MEKMKGSYAAMEKWRYIPHTIATAAEHLAASDALLESLATTGIPAMRWYSVASPALILGRGQPITHADAGRCQQASVALLRRSSGGTVVLMTPDMLMLDVAIPIGHRLYSADVTHSYRWFGEVWVAAWQTLGVATRLLNVAEAREDTAHLDPLVQRVCFGGFSPYEVIIEGTESVGGTRRKLVGFAQVRRRMGALLQAGVVLEWQASLALLAAVLRLTPPEQATLTEQLAIRATGLHDHLPPSLSPPPNTTTLFATVIAAWDQAVQGMVGVSLTEQ